MGDAQQFLRYWPHMILRRRLRLPPSLAVIRGCYELFYRGNIRNGDHTHFTNNGYVDLDADGRWQVDPPASLHDERYARRLYTFLIGLSGLSDFSGLDVAEIGSGLGGGANLVATTYRPRSMTGLDLSSEAVAFCRRCHQAGNLQFVEGNALDLPFESNRFDVILNVESSHCYPDFRQFVSEVDRVLKPGGTFLITDLRHKRNLNGFLSALAGPGWTEKCRVDITDSVIAAQEADSERRTALLEAGSTPRSVHRPIKDFTGCVGYDLHRKFVTRAASYLALCFEKPSDVKDASVASK